MYKTKLIMYIWIAIFATSIHCIIISITSMSLEKSTMGPSVSKEITYREAVVQLYGEAYVENLEQAVVEFKGALDLLPPESDAAGCVYINLGVAYARVLDIKNANDAYGKAVKIFHKSENEKLLKQVSRNLELLANVCESLNIAKKKE